MVSNGYKWVSYQRRMGRKLRLGELQQQQPIRSELGSDTSPSSHIFEYNPTIEGGDKWVMSKFRRTTILRPFCDIFERLLETQNYFFEKLPPGIAKTVFENPKGPHFGCWKKIIWIKFLSKPCDGIWSHDSKMLYLFGIVRPMPIEWLC